MADAPTVRLADVGTQLRRRWRVLVGITVACFGLAALVGFLRPPTYTATSVLTVEPITAQPFGDSSSNAPVNITTERAVVGSTEVAERARQIMESDEKPLDLIERITVTSPSESQVLQIDATASDPAAAAEIANAFAEGYLDVRADTVTANVDDVMKSLAERIATLNEQMPADRTSAEAAQIREEINSLRSQQSDLATIAINPGRVITVATPPESPSAPTPLIFAAGGLVGGLLLGIGIALLRDRLDPLVRSGARLAASTGVSVIDQNPRETVAEFLDRLAMRVGIDETESARVVGILGVDRTCAHLAGVALTGHLRGLGHRALFAWWADSNYAPVSGGAEVRRRADMLLLGASGEDGLARVSRFGRHVDVLVVTAVRWTRMAQIRRLINELAAAGTTVDTVVLMSTTVEQATTSPATEETRPQQPVRH